MKIGFVGLGIMGESMSENIVKKHDDEVYVFDFVKEKVELLESKGAIGCSSSLKLAEKSDVIISMVPKSEHSMAVYKEVLPALDDTKLCIDMSTIDPSVSVEISEMVKKTGAEFVDAPVVKSKRLGSLHCRKKFLKKLSSTSPCRSNCRKLCAFSAFAGVRLGVPSAFSPVTTLISPVFSSRTTSTSFSSFFFAI